VHTRARGVVVTRENAETKARPRHSQAGAKALGPEALARAVSHRRWRAVHARRSRPDVSDPRKPGSAEKEREPERVHPVDSASHAASYERPASGFSDSLLMHHVSSSRSRRVRVSEREPEQLDIDDELEVQTELDEGFDGWDVFKRDGEDEAT
jgi:hypothetical protein